MKPSHLKRNEIISAIMNNSNSKESDLPAFISCSVVRVVLGDVSVYSIQRQLFIRGHGDSLDY